LAQSNPIRLLQMQFSLLHAAIIMIRYYIVNVLEFVFLDQVD